METGQPSLLQLLLISSASCSSSLASANDELNGMVDPVVNQLSEYVLTAPSREDIKFIQSQQILTLSKLQKNALYILAKERMDKALVGKLKQLIKTKWRNDFKAISTDFIIRQLKGQISWQKDAKSVKLRRSSNLSRVSKAYRIGRVALLLENNPNANFFTIYEWFQAPIPSFGSSKPVVRQDSKLKHPANGLLERKKQREILVSELQLAKSALYKLKQVEPSVSRARLARMLKERSEIFAKESPKYAQEPDKFSIPYEPEYNNAERTAFTQAVASVLTIDEKKIVNALTKGNAVGFEVLNILEDYIDDGIRRSNDLCISIREEMDKPYLRKDDTVELGEILRNPFNPVVGVGEIVKLKKKIKKYKAYQISLIANANPNELKERSTEFHSETITTSENESFSSERGASSLVKTDRLELDKVFEKSVQKHFKVQAGLNVTARYGTVTANASMAADFSKSESEKVSNSMKSVNEMISTTLSEIVNEERNKTQRTFKEVYNEKNRHVVDNSSIGSAKSNIDLWLEQDEALQLFKYGKRMMLELLIPEPGIGVIQAYEASKKDPVAPQTYDVTPEGITEENYICWQTLIPKAEIPDPPHEYINLPYNFESEPDETANDDQESVNAKLISIPDGYVPVLARIATHACTLTDEYQIALIIGGKTIMNEKMIGGVDDVVALKIGAHHPAGLAVSVRFRDHRDKVAIVNLTIECKRSERLYKIWQNQAFKAIKEAEQEAKLDYERKKANEDPTPARRSIGSSPHFNQAKATNEMKKWCIQSIIGLPLNFREIVTFSIEEMVFTEPKQGLSPDFIIASQFLKGCFDWDNITYFYDETNLGDRRYQKYKQSLNEPDADFNAFLMAGAAYVLVPIIPQCEAWVLKYIELQKNPLVSPFDAMHMARTLTGPEQLLNQSYVEFDVLREILNEHKKGFIAAAGTLEVTLNSRVVFIRYPDGTHPDINPYLWVPSEEDIGRDIDIEGVGYIIEAIDSESLQITLNKNYQGKTSVRATFALGGIKVGEPWTVPVASTQEIAAGSLPALELINQNIPQ